MVGVLFKTFLPIIGHLIKIEIFLYEKGNLWIGGKPLFTLFKVHSSIILKTIVFIIFVHVNVEIQKLISKFGFPTDNNFSFFGVLALNRIEQDLVLDYD